MSKIWPDPFTDRGEDFWNFDNMVTEYEYEQERKRQRARASETGTAGSDPGSAKNGQSSRLTFTQTDRVKTELILLNKSDDEEFAEVVFKVQNDCVFPIEELRLDFHVFDRNGRILSDEIVFYYNVIKPGACAAVIDSVWPEDEYLQEEICDIQVYAYEYRAGGFSYNVDLDHMNAEIFSLYQEYAESEFSRADVISFDPGKQWYEDDIDMENAWFYVLYHLKNRSAAAVESVDFTVCLYDETGMCIGEIICRTDGISPGAVLKEECSFYREFGFQNIASFEVVKYEYTLETPDRSGCIRYIIDKVQRTAKGSAQ